MLRVLRPLFFRLLPFFDHILQLLLDALSVFFRNFQVPLPVPRILLEELLERADVYRFKGRQVLRAGALGEQPLRIGQASHVLRDLLLERLHPLVDLV